jgi:hypothetical protein
MNTLSAVQVAMRNAGEAAVIQNLERLGLAEPRQPDAQQIAAAGNLLQAVCHGASKTAGWWRHTKTGLDLIEVINNPQDAIQELLGGALVAQKLCLTHSEVSEAMEGHRKLLMDDKLPHRTMLEVELADTVIRIFDMSGGLGLDVAGAIAEKLAYNATRADHQPENRRAIGGKKF